MDKLEGVTWHNGGQLQFGPDGKLYFSTGDSAHTPLDDVPTPVTDPDNQAQDPRTRFGKLFRIDVDSVPSPVETVAYGLRNPWRFSFDRLTGDFYIADVGQEEWEEVDVQTNGGGQNYGWNVMEGAHCFNPPTGCNTAGLVLPAFEYSHGLNDANGCAIIGGYAYRGKRLPALVGHYFFGDLCGGWVKSFRLQGGAAVDVRDYTAQFATLPAITSFGEDGLGELYIIAQGGNVYRLAAAR